ncbi:hypothetical protein QQF64_034133 [Cirrhinus molitorella]|uniref:THAP-type domain-containing protein n=1 Tax=Cirrhinus molitorella TaxID=172907 RepID=A0ABR3MVY0_9TELE
MVNYCVCGGCTNSSLSGHRVHRFPCKKRDGAIFRAWVRFVQELSKAQTCCRWHNTCPVVHTAASSGPPPSATGEGVGEKHDGHGAVRDSARRKRQLWTTSLGSPVLAAEKLLKPVMVRCVTRFATQGSAKVVGICISPYGVPEIGKLQITAGSMRTKHCLVFHYTCSPFQIPPKNQQG